MSLLITIQVKRHFLKVVFSFYYSDEKEKMHCNAGYRTDMQYHIYLYKMSRNWYT